jgi:hypothetical protein
MPRRVFFSFHFANDFWRTQQVRNMNALEGQTLCSANAWEEVKRKGPANIERWIAENMEGKTCIVVLVGAETASRPWVIHEISKAWNDGRGVLGIRIHKLLDTGGLPSTAGVDPMSKVTFKGSSKSLSGIAPLKNPAGADSKAVYATISTNIENWIEEAITIRKNYKG